MGIFFVILAILFFLLLFAFLLTLSNIEFEIKNFLFNSNNEKNKIEEYLFYIRIKLLDKFTIYRIKIDGKKLNSIKNSNSFNKIIKRIKEEGREEIFKISNIKELKDLSINIKEINLYMDVCASDNIITAFLVAAVSSIISIILAKNINRFDKDKYEYRINPKFNDKLSLRVELNCIIDLKIVHIINVIYVKSKKRRGKNDERTSNRRAYVSSNG